MLNLTKILGLFCRNFCHPVPQGTTMVQERRAYAFEAYCFSFQVRLLVCIYMRCIFGEWTYSVSEDNKKFYEWYLSRDYWQSYFTVYARHLWWIWVFSASRRQLWTTKTAKITTYLQNEKVTRMKWPEQGRTWILSKNLGSNEGQIT